MPQAYYQEWLEEYGDEELDDPTGSLEADLESEEFEFVLAELDNLTDVTIPASTTIATTTTVATTTTTVATTTAAATTLLTTVAAPVLFASGGHNTSNNMIEDDQKKDIINEIIQEMNKAVKAANAKLDREEEVVAEAAGGAIFGDTEAKLKDAYSGMAATVERASFAEIVALVIMILVILYYADRFVKMAFRYSVQKNYQYLGRDDHGSRKGVVWFWWIVEELLERIWIPMWFQAGDIRAEVLGRLIGTDVERLMEAARESLRGDRPVNRHPSTPRTIVRTVKELYRGPARSTSTGVSMNATAGTTQARIIGESDDEEENARKWR